MRRVLWLGWLWLLLTAGAWAALPVPALQARVTDQTATLSAEQRAALESKLAAFEARKGSQLAVLLVPSTGEETIEQYGIRVAEQWKLGRKGVDDGVLLLIAKQDRALRIEVGYGLEGALNDAVSKRIISEIITPRFQQGDFHGGIDAGVDAMIKVVDGEPLPAPPPRRAGAGESSGFEGFVAPLMIAVVVGSVLRSFLGRLPAALLSAGGAGIVVWLGSGGLMMAIGLGVAVFFLTLLGIGGMVGSGGWHSGGGGRSGGGGFSGGGGGFGGGGASGRW